MTTSSTGEHTPEPWRWLNFGEPYMRLVSDAHPLPVLMGYLAQNEHGTGAGVSIRESDARRIVACVNVCKKLPTEILEKAQGGLGALHHDLANDLETSSRRIQSLEAALRETKVLIHEGYPGAAINVIDQALGVSHE